MSYRTSALLIRSGFVLLLVALSVQPVQTQLTWGNFVVELREGESVNHFAERHRVSLIDSAGSSHLLGATLSNLEEMSADNAVAALEPEFGVDLSETAMPASAGTGLLNPDMVALLNNPEVVNSFGSFIRKSLVKQPAMDLIGREEDGHHSGAGIRVAVIDTGVDAMHPALAGRILPGFNFVDNTENTQDLLPPDAWLNVSTVALLNPSTVALLNPDMVALLNDPRTRFLGHGTLVTGLIRVVAPSALFMPLKAFDDSGRTTSFTVAKAIRYAVDRNVDIINMSFDFNRPSTVVRDALDYAASRGVILVASAGNSGTDTTVYPAIHPSVIAVAATDQEDRKAHFSNYGAAIDVTAPGDRLISTYPGGRYAAVAGTSFSAALVSGEAALIRSAGTFQANDVASRILKSAKDIGTKNPNMLLGKGRIRVSEALESDSNQD